MHDRSFDFAHSPAGRLALGDIAAQGEVLQHRRPWLHLFARLEIDGRFRGKFDSSDIVQQTLLEACRDLPKFRGGTESGWAAAWAAVRMLWSVP